MILGYELQRRERSFSPFILQKESATGHKINILKRSREIALSSNVCVAGSVKVMETATGGTDWSSHVQRAERPPESADQRVLSAAAGLGEAVVLSAKALQRTVLYMVSSSEPF